MAKVESKYWWIAGGVITVLTLGFLYKRQITRFGKDVVNYIFTKEQEYYLADLNPEYVNVFKKFIEEVERDLGYKVLLTSGNRTFQKQAELHKENSQNAKVGKSLHNYGVAIDLNLISKKDGSILKKASTSAEWEKTGVVKVANKYGLKWGGGKNFGSYHDPVHFEIPLSSDKLYAQGIKQFGSESKIIGNRVNIT